MQRASDRTRVRRHPERGRYEREAIDSVLDASFFGHVAFVDEGQPFCIPMLQARIGDTVYVHGSSASRTVRTLATGVPACLTVTLLDGLVLARSVFNHSANYRSAVLLGSFRRLEGDDERADAFRAFVEKLIPGRWDEVRGPSAKELKATGILALEIDEASMKVRAGGPGEHDAEDAKTIAAWAGVLPLVTTFGEPEPAADLRDGTALSESVRRLLAS